MIECDLINYNITNKHNAILYIINFILSNKTIKTINNNNIVKHVRYKYKNSNVDFISILTIK